MSSDSTPTPEARVRTLQIIAAALTLGVIAFAVIALVLRPGMAQQNEGARVAGLPLITTIAVALAFAQIAASIALPTVMAANGRRRLAGTADDGPWYALYQTRLIIRLALLEGPAIFLLVAYLLEGRVVSLAVAAVLVGLMLTHFPTAGGVSGWVQSQKDRAEMERSQVG